MWKALVYTALAVYTISANELSEEDLTSSLSEEVGSASDVADDSGAHEESSSALGDELKTRFLGIGDALRRVNGAITGAVRGAVMGAVTGHMEARRPPKTDDDEDDFK